MNSIKEKRNMIDCEIGMTSTRRNKKIGRKKKIFSFTPNNVLAGIIFSEILEKPKGIKNR